MQFGGDPLDDELVQVAAVAVKWLESRGWTQPGALTAVSAERARQDLKWGTVDKCDCSPDRMNTVLGEEVGEVAHAVNEAIGQ